MKYVTFNIAQKLKEKGFDEKCTKYFLEKDKQIHTGFQDEYWGDYSEINWNQKVIGIKPFTGFISAPTISDVVDWLLNEHQINIHISAVGKEETTFKECKWWFSLYKDTVYNLKESTVFLNTGIKEFNSKKEACLAAIEYALELVTYQN